jgi:hypothetical protein
MPEPIQQLTGQGSAIEITKDNVPHDFRKAMASLPFVFGFGIL